MFKTLNIYRTNSVWTMTLEEMQERLESHQFFPAGPTQAESYGWIPPRQQLNGALVESIGGQRIMLLKIETRTVPTEAINKMLAEQAAKYEQETGRKMGAKHKKEIKEEIVLTLLPQAFPRTSTAFVWFDLENRRLLTDASSQTVSDKAITLLVECLPGLMVRPLCTQTSAKASMTNWLNAEDPNDLPAQLSLGRECELRAADESKAAVRFSRHHLDSPDVRKHLAQGKLPVNLAMNWEGRVSFLLNEGLQLKKIEFLDVVFETERDGKGDLFDADVAISTGELGQLIPVLIEALGGEAELKDPEVVPAKPAAAASPAAMSDAALASFAAIPTMYEQAVALVTGPGGRPSISFVQRQLKIGYNQAAMLLEDMEKAGVVTPMNGMGMREITLKQPALAA